MLTPWNPEFDDYLHDESRRVGTAESISFPTTEAEVIDSIAEARALGRRVTVQGARTGIVGGAVPQGGHVLNLSRTKHIGEVREDEASGEYRLTVQPGALLSEVRAAADPHGVFLPPDPTEASASIGGMVACNASGALSFHYGPTRAWVSALRLVTSDGDVLAIRRAEHFARGRSFTLTTEGGRAITGNLPGYDLPKVKTAAGYFASDDMDLLDVFAGMEGTLGVITEIELRLIPRPSAIHGLMVFLPSQASALEFVSRARGDSGSDGDSEIPTESGCRPVAIEFFNNNSLDLLRRMSENPAFEAIPRLKAHYHSAIYLEFHGEDDDALEECVMQAMESAADLGGSDEDTWYATTDRELEPLKAFRHAIPEAVNLLVGQRKADWPGITKLGTDMSVPDRYLADAMNMYSSDMENSGLDWVAFGHIGDNHVHVNIIPKDPDQYDTGKSLYTSWASAIVGVGGSISAEHGIGKLKAPLLKLMFGDECIRQMRSFRLLFDPDLVLNPGDLF